MKQGPEAARLAGLERENAELRSKLSARSAEKRRPEISKREWLMAEAERVAHLGSWTWNLRTNEVYWSDELYRIFGLDPRTDQGTYDAFFAAVHPDDRARLRAHSARQVEGMTTGPVRYRIVRPTGEVREVLMEGDFVDGPDGSRDHVLGTIVDETDKLRTAALLAQTVSELSEAQQLARLGSWRWTLATRRVEWSDGMYRLLGIDPQEPANEQLFYRHVHPDDVEKVRAVEKRATGSGLSIEFEMRLVRRDGAVREAVMRSRPIFDASGVLAGFQGVVQDVSERKALEEAARHAQKMEAVGTLAGGVAHDFNNYLMVLSGNVDLLSIGLSDNVRAQHSLEAIRYACDRCVNLTEQLLTLSRKRPPRPACFDLPRRLSGMAEVLRSALGATIELRLMSEPNTPPVYADPLQVEHALMNLALNARDSMRDGGILAVRVEGVCIEQGKQTELSAGYYVRMSVSDTGCGIPAELHSRIFEPFFTTKAVGKGTGLGLAMVYGIVREAGGAIEVESEPGQGTTFHLYFRPAEGRASSLPPAPPKATDVVASGQGQRILLVEDIQLVRELLSEQLLQAGYQVLTAVDGVTALEILAAEGADALISDVVMPNMGGFELVRIAREQRPGLPCMLVSGYAPSELGEAEHIKSVPLLRKPFNGSELCRAVRDLLMSTSVEQV